MKHSLKEALFIKGKALGIPVSGTFELTKVCNLNCKMCYIHDGKAQKELPADFWIRIGKDAASKGMLYLLLTGGEPFLRKDFLYIYEELSKLGLRISINSNGTVISKEAISVFKQYPPEQVNITLYGSSNETYGKLCGKEDAYNAVISNIKALKKVGVKVAINTTFTKYNLSDMEDIISYALAEKIPVRMASYLFPSLNSDSQQSFSLSPEEVGKVCARFEKLTLPADRIERRKQLVSDILEEESSEDELLGQEPIKREMLCRESLKREPSKSPSDWKLNQKGSRCMAGCGAFWVSWDGKLYSCGMLRNGESLMEHGFENTFYKIREKASEYQYPDECMNCTRIRICPFCQAVYQSLGKNMEQIRSHMCARTEAYLNEYRYLQ